MQSVVSRESGWRWMIRIHVWSSSARTDVLGHSQPELTKLGDEQAAGRSNLLNALKRTRANKTGLVAFCCLCPSTSPGREPCIPLKPKNGLNGAPNLCCRYAGNAR